MNNSQHLYQRSYWIIKYGIVNLLLYSQEHRQVENGEEPEIEAIDELKPQGEDPKDKKGSKGAKKEEKKPQKGDKTNPKDEEDKAKLEELRREEM